MQQLNYSFSSPAPTMSLIGTGIQPTVPGFTTTLGKYENVLVSGNYAYVAAAGSGSGATTGLSLVIYNVSNPAAPYAVSYLQTFASTWSSGPSFLNGSYQMALQGKYLYVFSSGSSVFYIVDVSNPATPTNVGRLLITNSPGSLYGGAVAGNYAYIATQNKGLTVVDVSTPTAPLQVYQEGGTTNKSLSAFVLGTKAYTTNYQTTAPWTVRYLKIWDITTPTAPVLLTTYTLPAGTKPGEVTVVGNYAYVADLNTNSVQIVDVTNPLSPNYLASMQASNSFNVANESQTGIGIDGNYAYIPSGLNATYGGSIDFFDITNKLAPVKIATLQEGVANSVFGACTIYNNLIYVADYGVAPGSMSSLNIYSTQTYVSQAIPSRDLNAMSAQLSTTSGAKGVFNLQASDDVVTSDSTVPTNWSDIPNTNSSASGANLYLIPKTDVSYQYTRFQYTNTGSGNLAVTLKYLGIN